MADLKFNTIHNPHDNKQDIKINYEIKPISLKLLWHTNNTVTTSISGYHGNQETLPLYTRTNRQPFT